MFWAGFRQVVSVVFQECPFRERNQFEGAGHPNILWETGIPPRRAAPTGAKQVVTCFTPGTLVTTIKGKIAVEALRSDDRILTRDCGFQPLVWRGLRRRQGPGSDTTAFDHPVLIRAGALGAGQPARDMVVSPGHRMLCSAPDLLRNVADPEALVEARALVGLPGITRTFRPADTYVHLLMEQHQVILAESTWTESFQLSRASARTLSQANVKDLQAPQQITPQAPARPCLQFIELPLLKTA